MSRLLANCSTTTTSSSSGSVTTICDCECEGCCCQYLTFEAHGGGDLWVYYLQSPYTGSPDIAPSFSTCVYGVGSYGIDIVRVEAYFDECPPFNGSGSPDLVFNNYTNDPCVIPNANDYACITLLFFKRLPYPAYTEGARCTVKLTL